MSINANWQRPFSEAAEAKTTAITHVLTETGGKAIVDVTTTINSTSKIIARLVLTPVLTGSTLKYQVNLLTFEGDAHGNYTSATNPADSTAANAGASAQVVVPDTINLDAYYTAAGVNRTDPTP